MSEDNIHAETIKKLDQQFSLVLDSGLLDEMKSLIESGASKVEAMKLAILSLASQNQQLESENNHLTQQYHGLLRRLDELEK